MHRSKGSWAHESSDGGSIWLQPSNRELEARGAEEARWASTSGPIHRRAVENPDRPHEACQDRALPVHRSRLGGFLQQQPTFSCTTIGAGSAGYTRGKSERPATTSVSLGDKHGILLITSRFPFGS